MKLTIVKNSNKLLRSFMDVHYSHPKGFVGRNICYSVEHGGEVYGFIVSGSATRFLPGRDEFLQADSLKILNQIINNTFFHVEKIQGKYPCRNFTENIVEEWENVAPQDWQVKYGDSVIALETLVELPRTGEVYRRRGWECVGVTKGFTCKRTAGKGTDSWTGKRIWNTTELHPKLVFMKNV